MAKAQIDKGKFYERVMSAMAGAKKSVHFYSISCCFGFYSLGVSNFEKMLNALADRLAPRIGGRYLDVRVIVKVDDYNLIDLYAGQCLRALEKDYEATGESGPREVFRVMPPRNEMVQFLIVDDNVVISSGVQEEEFNRTLNLVLNKVEGAIEFRESDDTAEFVRLRKLFDEAWPSASPLDVNVPQISPVRLRFVLEQFKKVARAKDEREFQLMLDGYLQGEFDASVIDFESAAGRSRIDLVAGKRPQHEKIGIEVKLRATDADIHGIVGQMRNYKKEYAHVFLVVGQPRYSPQRRLDLLAELKESGSILVELA